MDIKLYTTTGCFYCEKTKELFKRANLKYESYEVIPQKNLQDELPEGCRWKKDFRQIHPLAQAFPHVVIDGKEFMGLVEVARYLLKEGLVSASN